MAVAYLVIGALLVNIVNAVVATLLTGVTISVAATEVGSPSRMTEHSTRTRILDAAQRLFGERGFTATKIRDVAEVAGVSPALVMKLTGSKSDLFRAAAPEATSIADLAGRRGEPMGHRLVRTIVERRDADDYDYWATVPMLIHEARDRNTARADFREAALQRLATRIDDESDDLTRTRVLATLLLGLATSLRTVDLIPTTRSRVSNSSRPTGISCRPRSRSASAQGARSLRHRFSSRASLRST